MAKKQAYFAQAEKLFVENGIPMSGISKTLDISEKTLREWKKEGDWDRKRLQFLKNQNSCNTELYELLRKLTQKVNEDIDNGAMPEAGILYTIKALAGSLPKIKVYEDQNIQEQLEQKEEKASTEDIVSKVNDILGIR
jgi:uncharacterized protein YjcR